jgi:hypothetical protein
MAWALLSPVHPEGEGMPGTGKTAGEVVGALRPAFDFPRTEPTEQVSGASLAPWSLAAFLALEAAVFAGALASGKIPPVVLSLFRALLTF